MDELTRAVDRAQDRVDELRRLLRDVRAARDTVPSLSAPAAAVGAPGVWTGAAASRLHHDELAPLSGRLPRALDRIERAVEDELVQAQRDLGRAQERADQAVEVADQDAR